MDSLFECSNDEDGQYIDLLLNPERYTGKHVRDWEFAAWPLTSQ
jgi:hypothetical protein